MDQITICNAALGRVGANRISSLTNDPRRKESLACRDNWDLARDFALEAQDWTFASKRAIPTKMAEAPVSAYLYAYSIPVDSVAVRTLSNRLEKEWENGIYWAKEGKTVVCDWDEPVYLRYTSRVLDVCSWSPTFKQVMVICLAWHMAMGLTRSKRISDAQEAAMWNMLSEASVNDGKQGRSPRTRSGRYIEVR